MRSLRSGSVLLVGPIILVAAGVPVYLLSDVPFGPLFEIFLCLTVAGLILTLLLPSVRLMKANRWVFKPFGVLLLLASLLVCLLAAVVTIDYTLLPWVGAKRNLTAEQWREDLDYLAREILRLDMNDPTMGSGANDIVENAQNAGLGIGDENDPSWDYREIVNGTPTNIIDKGIHVVNKNLTLMQNHPNPTSTYTTIRFSVPHKLRKGKVSFEIVNATGKIIKQVKLNSTRTQFIWNLINDNSKRVPNGIYLYKISINGYSASKKMTVKH